MRNNECSDFAELERFFIALGAPIRNPTNFGWMTAVLQRARASGRRVLLGGLYGNSTISWNGWSQAASHLRRGRLLLAYRQWRLYYQNTPYSRWVALRKLLIEPVIPAGLEIGLIDDDTRTALRLGKCTPPSAPILPLRCVPIRAPKSGSRFSLSHETRRTHEKPNACRLRGRRQAAEKAVSGVEVRDPTADIDVISYCFGIPPEQYLAEGIDRSLIRRAMWGLVPEIVLTNRLSGLQAADWYEKLEDQRADLAREVGELLKLPLASKIIDVARLETALKNWPKSGWHTSKVFREYNLALTRGLAGGRFLRWLETTN